MKYWRGYLTAAILAAATWGLREFAAAHTALVDLIYPYVTRMAQNFLVDWNSTVDYCIWQVLLLVILALVVASIVLMVVLRWNPIQWFGWVCAVAAAIVFLNTGIYGLNAFSGPLAEDVRLEETDYTVTELEKAAVYYLEQANALADQVERDGSGEVIFGEFADLAQQAADGFETLVYEESEPVFAGSLAPVKQLGWAGQFTARGITGVTVGITNEGMADVDCCLLVVEANAKITPAEEELITKFKKRNLKAVLAINKVDLLKDKEELFEIIKNYTDLFDFEAVVPVSAKTNDGLDVLLSELEKFAVPSVHFFDENSFTDQPERVITAEMIREKLLRCLEKEVPHGIAVDIERFAERNDADILDIDAAIYCERQSHKGIVIGKGGQTLKKIGTLARHDLENFFEIKVNLKLWVKVKENWRTSNSIIHGLGLD